MSTARERTVAVLGATGLVGRLVVELLESRAFPVTTLLPLASERSAGRRLRFRGRDLVVEPATPERLAAADLVLSSAGAAVSRALLPGAAAAGALCVDNTSAFRLEPDVPLVVPEVNPGALTGLGVGRVGGAIVANPNCSTIQLVMALAPLRAAAGLRRCVVSTYQSLSGAGAGATERFRTASAAWLADGTPSAEPAFDLRAAIGALDAQGHAEEESKMMAETDKILGAPARVAVTCVRVPVFVGHATSVWIETREALTPAHARELLAAAPGVCVAPPGAPPTPRAVAGDDRVHVGRLRAGRDRNTLQLWIVADNLRKGAALNAVQIAEHVLDARRASA